MIPLDTTVPFIRAVCAVMDGDGHYMVAIYQLGISASQVVAALAAM